MYVILYNKITITYRTEDINPVLWGLRIGMDDSTRLISHNLKKIRQEKAISLDKLAELTGVSKSMLGQISAVRSEPDHCHHLEDRQRVEDPLSPPC